MAGSTQTVAFDEPALVAQAKQGDRSAFTELVNRYARNIFRLARHITKNDQDAEDVLQETFLKAYSRLEQFHGDSKFYTWLVRIGVNESLMKIRRRKDGKFVALDQEFETGEGTLVKELPADGENPEESYGREEIRQALSRASGYSLYSSCETELCWVSQSGGRGGCPKTFRRTWWSSPNGLPPSRPVVSICSTSAGRGVSFVPIVRPPRAGQQPARPCIAAPVAGRPLQRRERSCTTRGCR